METIPLQFGDIVAVSLSGLKLVILATQLKHAENRSIPEGTNLATAPMIVPSVGPNDAGMLLVCGPSKIVQPGAELRKSEIDGPEVCIDVHLIEDHYPQN